MYPFVICIWIRGCVRPWSLHVTPSNFLADSLRSPWTNVFTDPKSRMKVNRILQPFGCCRFQANQWLVVLRSCRCLYWECLLSRNFSGLKTRSSRWAYVATRNWPWTQKMPSYSGWQIFEKNIFDHFGGVNVEIHWGATWGLPSPGI